ncbi:putative organic solute transporter subunit alpha/Transmembrane protein [Helianthus anomalus]
MVYVFKNHSPFLDQNSLMKKIRGLALMGILKYSAFPWTTLVAAVFVFVSLTLSIFLLFQHLSAYKNPEEQKFLFGIVLMVPSYAVESMGRFKVTVIGLEFAYLTARSYREN